jgi:hypothetical protein
MSSLRLATKSRMTAHTIGNVSKVNAPYLNAKMTFRKVVVLGAVMSAASSTCKITSGLMLATPPLNAIITDVRSAVNRIASY